MSESEIPGQVMVDLEGEQSAAEGGRRMVLNASGNVREGRYYLQMAGAEARERLLLAAATEWGVAASSLVAKDSVITHAKSKRKTTYGAIAAKAAQVQLADPSLIKIKPVDKWTLMGTEQFNREVVDVLHFVGAGDRFIAREFQGRFLRLGLRGGLLGALGAYLFILGGGALSSSMLDGASALQIQALFGSFGIGWRGCSRTAARR